MWLYRGETEKYAALLEEYRTELGDMLPFAQRVGQLTEDIQNCKAEAKLVLERAPRKYKKRIAEEYDTRVASMEHKLVVAKAAVWLYEKFGEGECRDIPGLCRAASLVDIEEKGWSLPPGAYVAWLQRRTTGWILLSGWGRFTGNC